MKEKIKLILVESKDQNDFCVDCIFSCEGFCYEPEEINCFAMRPDKTKKYHWEIGYAI